MIRSQSNGEWMVCFGVSVTYFWLHSWLHSLEELSQAARSKRYPIATAREMNVHDLAACYRTCAHEGHAILVFGYDFVRADGFMAFVARIATISGIAEFQLAEHPR